MDLESFWVSKHIKVLERCKLQFYGEWHSFLLRTLSTSSFGCLFIPFIIKWKFIMYLYVLIYILIYVRTEPLTCGVSVRTELNCRYLVRDDAFWCQGRWRKLFFSFCRWGPWDLERESNRPRSHHRHHLSQGVCEQGWNPKFAINSLTFHTCMPKIGIPAVFPHRVASRSHGDDGCGRLCEVGSQELVQKDQIPTSLLITGVTRNELTSLDLYPHLQTGGNSTDQWGFNYVSDISHSVHQLS